MVMSSVFQGAVVSTNVDCGLWTWRIVALAVFLGEESSVDPGEVGHITQTVSVLGLDVVPVPGI